MEKNGDFLNEHKNGDRKQKQIHCVSLAQSIPEKEILTNNGGQTSRNIRESDFLK